MNPSKDSLSTEQIATLLNLKELTKREIIIFFATDNYEAAKDLNSLPGVIVETRAIDSFFRAFGIPTFIARNWKACNLEELLWYIYEFGHHYLDRAGIVSLGHGCNFSFMERIFDLTGTPVYWSQCQECLGKVDRLLISRHCRALVKKYAVGAVITGDPHLVKTHKKMMAEFSVANDGEIVSDDDRRLVEALSGVLKNLHGQGDLIDLLMDVFRRNDWAQKSFSCGGWWPIERVDPVFPTWKCMTPIDLTVEADQPDLDMNGADLPPPTTEQSVSHPIVARPSELQPGMFYKADAATEDAGTDGESEWKRPRLDHLPASPKFPQYVVGHKNDFVENQAVHYSAVSRRRDDVRRHSSPLERHPRRPNPGHFTRVQRPPRISIRNIEPTQSFTSPYLNLNPQNMRHEQNVVVNVQPRRFRTNSRHS